MFRSLIVTTLFALAVSFGSVATVSAEEPDQGDSATTLEALREEVRLLKLKVNELEKQVSDLQRQLTLPEVPIIDLDWESPPILEEGEDIMVIPSTQLPMDMYPPSGMIWPWNHDYGLYVFPGFDAPEQEYRSHGDQ